MNAIGYSIFGYNKQHDGCFSFGSYLRGLSLNLRMSQIIYPQWGIHIAVDDSTYNSPYKEFFDYHNASDRITVTVVPDNKLCVMMLQRLLPIFTGYDRVICRDIDSLLTYRERQAVEYWISSGRIAGAIGDSISHSIVLMGGMCAFSSKEFREVMGVETFDELLELGKNIDFDTKGADQIFLNTIVLPKVAHSIVEHFPLGMPNSFRERWFNYIQDEVIQDIAPVLKESNLLTSHIGASGFPEQPALKFFNQYLTEKQKEYFLTIDKKFPQTFYWCNEL